MVFPKKYFGIIKNASVIIFGIVIGKGIAIALTPLLTDLYLPEEFGIFAVYVSGGQILSALYTFKYEINFLSIEGKFHNDLVVFLRTNALVFALISFIIALFLYFANIIVLEYCFIPIYAFIISMYEIERMRKVFGQEFKIISTTEVSRNSIASIIPLSKYLFGFFPFGLIWGIVFAQIVTIRILGLRSLFPIMSFSNWWIKFKSEFQNMSQIGGAKIINLINSESIPLIIVALFDTKLAGIFFIAMRIGAVPIGVITTALGDVVNNLFSKYYLNVNKRKELKKIFFIIFSVLFVLASFAIIIIYFSIDFVVDTFLSKEFNTVKLVVKYSLLYYFGLIVTRPISSYFNIIKKYKWTLLWDSSRFIILFIFSIVAIFMNFEFYTFVLGLSFSLIIGYLLYPLLVLVIKK